MIAAFGVGVFAAAQVRLQFLKIFSGLVLLFNYRPGGDIELLLISSYISTINVQLVC
jgi:hypothetical protein